MELRHTIEIGATPEVVYEWFLGLDRHYRTWHPDHRACEWRSRRGEVGGVLYAEELIHGRLHRLRFRMTEVVPGRKLAFRVLGAVGWLVPRGDFVVEEQPTGCRFSAGLTVRMGRLLRWLLPRHHRALVAHMREEGENLKRILEVHPSVLSSPAIFARSG